MPALERRDLFGRTETELVAAIGHAKIVYAIASGYTGGEGLALKLAIRRANLDVDRRQLAIMRGEAADDSPRLTAAGREKQNRELAALERHSHRKSEGSRT